MGIRNNQKIGLDRGNMKKIAIITLHNVNNYGSVLQAYATQCFFMSLGLDPVIIDFRRPWETKIGYFFYLNSFCFKELARNILYLPSKIIQLGPFCNFRKKHLKLTKKIYTSCSKLKTTPVKADYYCSGSDQVWNSGWNNGVIKEYFLNFVTQSTAKKLSFSSSFGNSDISDEECSVIKNLLKTYDLITVREEQSVDLLKNKLGLKSLEILDPTLQVNGDFWKKMCVPKRMIEEKYILLIQLNRNHDFDNLAVKFSNNKKFKLIRLCLRVDQLFLPGKCVLLPEVKDYIRLIRDAEYVLTDSFHAISFSLNLEKQFYVYFPQKYSERLKNILSILQLSNRELNNNYSNDSIDYNKVCLVLEQERKVAKNIFAKFFN